jgi:hypothetical protein
MVVSVDYKTGCLICGNELVYEKSFRSFECNYCGGNYDSNVSCINGHFICNQCHSLSGNELIEQFCISTRLEDPLAMATYLMKDPRIKMHGPENHFLVPAVLLAAYYNVNKDPDKKKKEIKEALRRTEKIPGGYCGSHGACGAAVGTGVFISLITEATPLSKREWKLANLITSRSLLSVANSGGPRCCKRTAYSAIIEAVNFLDEYFDTPISNNGLISCEFVALNNECTFDECPFYSKERN